jgi:hypothetical protein
MKPARPLPLVLLAGAVALFGWLLLDTWTRRGALPPPLPWTAPVGTVGLALAVLAAGLPVRRWVRGGREHRMDPLLAARTAVFAKAGAYVGALLAGWYLAQAIDLLPDLVGTRRTRLVLALAAAAAAVVLAGAGLLVQRWCRVPPRDDEES